MTTDEKLMFIDVLLMGLIIFALVFYALDGWDLWARFLMGWTVGRLGSLIFLKLLS